MPTFDGDLPPSTPPSTIPKETLLNKKLASAHNELKDVAAKLKSVYTDVHETFAKYKTKKTHNPAFAPTLATASTKLVGMDARALVLFEKGEESTPHYTPSSSGIGIIGNGGGHSGIGIGIISGSGSIIGINP